MEIVYIIVSLVGLHIGLYKIFEKAGKPAWQGLVPVLSWWGIIDIIGGRRWWFPLLFVPILNIFIWATMMAYLCKSFSRFSFWDTALMVIAPFIMSPLIGYKDNRPYIGKAFQLQKAFDKEAKQLQKQKKDKELRKLERNHPIPKKGSIRGLADTVVFAVFAASFIRLFLIEAYTIPTPSMEGSLLVGDYLFVSKVHYGSRMPMTPLSFPLVHNTMPVVGGESYVEWLKWDYRRAPKITNVGRYDPVVFNYPEGDTIFQGLPYGQQFYNQLYQSQGRLSREDLLRTYADRIAVRPVDKRDHYIKRCVGIPGDKIEVVNGQLMVNDQPSEKIPNVQFAYQIVQNAPMSAQELQRIEDDLEIDIIPQQGLAFLSPEKKAAMEQHPKIDSLKSTWKPKGQWEPSIFPHDKVNFPWNNDNYGPIVVPKSGETVQLTMQNIALYKRIIGVYEGNDFRVDKGVIFINGERADSYTFKMDYYWMMGDNRHQSADSRSWGFVPANHIVGTPLFIFFSLEDGDGWPWERIRWGRLFKGAYGMD